MVKMNQQDSIYNNGLHPPPPWQTLRELLTPIHVLKWHLRARKNKTKNPVLPPHPAIVIPGLGASDLSTFPLRQRLSKSGLHVYKGGIGRNNGDVKKLLIKAERHLLDVFESCQEPVILIGWSLGGIIARQLARKQPNKVRSVCTLGSPIVGGGKYSAYAPVYKKMGYDLDKMEQLCNRREAHPIPVPTLSIYAKQDGIVFWRASIDRFNAHTDHMEVACNHFAMGFSEDVCDVLVGWLSKKQNENPA